jgi:hypothetical protein
MFSTCKFGILDKGEGEFNWREIVIFNISSKLEAGSVLTSNVRFLYCSARAIAVAQESAVFPTPPLPVKKVYRVKDTLERTNGVLASE